MFRGTGIRAQSNVMVQSCREPIPTRITASPHLSVVPSRFMGCLVVTNGVASYTTAAAALFSSLQNVVFCSLLNQSLDFPYK